MEFIKLLFLILIFFLSVLITRWVFRIDYVIKILEKTANNIEEMKKQNIVLIKQQDEIIELLDTDKEKY